MAATEERILPTVPEAEPQVATEPSKEGNPPPKSAKTKKATGPKAVKSKKVPAPRKRGPAAHPPYFAMIEDAIATLKEKTGSSQYAITKFIEDKQKKLPSNFRKLLLVHLKKQVTQGKLVKVKSSYKLLSTQLSKPAAASVPVKKLAPAAKPKPKAKAAAAAKEKKTVVSKAKPKPKTAAAKAKPAEKAKPTAKPKAASKRKAPEKGTSEKKPASKVAKTATRSTPSRKVSVAKKKPAVKKAAPSKKGSAVKKPKTVKKVAPKKK